MTIKKKNVIQTIGTTIDNYTHVTNGADYEYIELFEGNYSVAEFDRNDVMIMCKALNITSDDLTA